MERYSKSAHKTGTGLFKHHSKFTADKASKRKVKVSQFEKTGHSKRYQKYMQRKRDIEMEMDKVKVTIGDASFSFQSDGTWQNSISNPQSGSKNESKLKKDFAKLESENSRLKLSYELLLNMVISKNYKIEKLESELQKLRGIISKPSMLFPDSESSDYD